MPSNTLIAWVTIGLLYLCAPGRAIPAYRPGDGSNWEVSGSSSQPPRYTEEAWTDFESQMNNVNPQEGYYESQSNEMAENDAEDGNTFYQYADQAHAFPDLNPNPADTYPDAQSSEQSSWDHDFERASAFRIKHRTDVQHEIDARFKLGGKEEEAARKRHTWSLDTGNKKRKSVKYLNFGKATPNVPWMNRFGPEDLALIHENYAQETKRTVPAEELLLRYGNWNIGFALLSQVKKHHKLAVEHLHRCQQAHKWKMNIDDVYRRFDPSVTYTPAGPVEIPM